VLLLVYPSARAQNSHASAGVAYFQQGQYAKALEEFKQARDERPKDAPIFNLLGITETKLGELAQANVDYEHAIGLNPAFAGARKNLAVNLMTASRYADAEEQLWSIGQDRQVKVLLRDVGGHRLNGPNDLWIDSKGGIFFTDPYYQRDYWTRAHSDLDGEKVYYLPKGGKQPVVAAADVKKPNGIVGTPDGSLLYVSDIGDGKTYAYTIGPGGRLSGRRLFCMQGSDGMTLDQRGNVYLTGDGVTVYDPAGKKIAHIPVPEKWTANLCFGGRDRKTLFITASEGVYILRMRVRGVE